MSGLGTAITNSFQIGQAELRIGPMSKAGKLTQANSVGLLKTSSVSLAKTYTELKAGQTNSRIASAMTGYDLDVSADLYEFTRRNLTMLMDSSFNNSASNPSGLVLDDEGDVVDAITVNVLPEASIKVSGMSTQFMTELKTSSGRWVVATDNSGVIGYGLAATTADTAAGDDVAPTSTKVDSVKASASALSSSLESLLKNGSAKAIGAKTNAYVTKLVEAVNLLNALVLKKTSDDIEATKADINKLVSELPTLPTATGTVDKAEVLTVVPTKASIQVGGTQPSGSTRIIASGTSAWSIPSITSKYITTGGVYVSTDFHDTSVVTGNIKIGNFFTPYKAGTAHAAEVLSTITSNAIAVAKEKLDAAITDFAEFNTTPGAAAVSGAETVSIKFQTVPTKTLGTGAKLTLTMLPTDMVSTGFCTKDGYIVSGSSGSFTSKDLVGTSFNWNGASPVFSDTFGMYSKDRPNTVRLIDITETTATSEGIKFTFDAAKAGIQLGETGEHFIYRANPIALNADMANSYFTVDIISKDATTGVVSGFRFWKVGIQGNLDYSFSTDNYATIPIKLAVFEATGSDTDVRGALYEVRDLVAKNKFGMFWGG